MILSHVPKQTVIGLFGVPWLPEIIIVIAPRCLAQVTLPLPLRQAAEVEIDSGDAALGTFAHLTAPEQEVERCVRRDGRDGVNLHRHAAEFPAPRAGTADSPGGEPAAVLHAAR